MVDKNLFLHDLAVVAIMKNEGHYLKEWLDYHLLAGVDHFYIYDNESPDNQREVAEPYVKAGLVDYISAPGKIMQHASYNAAVKRFKFHSRYMAFIDADEFIYPKVAVEGVVDVVDEILSRDPNTAGLGINWQNFGSNGHEKADYSRGVLERFTRRAPKDWIGLNNVFKTIASPRAINFIPSAHFAVYFEGFYAINEKNEIVRTNPHTSISAEKIVVNHYCCKSLEEFLLKRGRGDTVRMNGDKYNNKIFTSKDRNDEFDDGILHYRDERAKTYHPPDKSHADERLLTALMKNLSPTLLPTTPPEFFAGKMETFLTCRAVAAYLKTKLPDDTLAKNFEEVSLKAILRSFVGMTLADARMFIRELPQLLSLPYPVVKDIRNAAIQIIPQMMDVFRLNYMFENYVEINCMQDLLKLIKEE